MKFSNIRLLVNNFDSCFHFYNNMLGLECTWGAAGDNYASFNIGHESGLALFRAELMEIAVTKAGAGKSEIELDKIAIILQVDNLYETYSRLKGNGVDFLTEPEDMAAWGISICS